MANPFYGVGSGGQQMGGFASMLQQFNQFKQNFQGDPREKVQELLQSGQMSQSQFNQLYSKATEIYNSGLFSGGNPLANFFKWS